MQGLGLQGIGPAQQRRIIGHRSPVQSAEPAQDQVLIHLLFCFLITPLVEVLEDEHTQQDLHRRRVSPMHQREAKAVPEIGTDLLVEFVILQQPIQVLEHRVDALGHARHPRKHILGFVAVNQHRVSLLCAKSVC